MRSFMHIDFNEQQVPGAATLLKFRHMLEASSEKRMRLYIMESPGI